MDSSGSLLNREGLRYYKAPVSSDFHVEPQATSFNCAGANLLFVQAVDRFGLTFSSGNFEAAPRRMSALVSIRFASY
jgi:hypothetical protein